MIQGVKTATLGERPSYPKDERCLISLAALSPGGGVYFSTVWIEWLPELCGNY